MASISCERSGFHSHSKRRDQRREAVPRSTGGNAFGKILTRMNLEGHAIKMKEGPPDVEYQPWYPLTIILSTVGEETITYSSLAGEIRKQLDPSATLFKQGTGNDKGVVITRIETIQMWNLSGDLIGLSVYDYVTSVKGQSSEAVFGGVDVGNNHRVPAIGYRMSMINQSFTLRNGNNKDDDDLDRIFSIFCAPTDVVITYVNVLWRCDGPSKLMRLSDTEKYISAYKLRRRSERRNVPHVKAMNFTEDVLPSQRKIPLVPQVPLVQYVRAVESTSSDAFIELSSPNGETEVPVEYHGSKTTVTLDHQWCNVE